MAMSALLLSTSFTLPTLLINSITIRKFNLAGNPEEEQGRLRRFAQQNFREAEVNARRRKKKRKRKSITAAVATSSKALHAATFSAPSKVSSWLKLSTSTPTLLGSCKRSEDTYTTSLESRIDST